MRELAEQLGVRFHGTPTGRQMIGLARTARDLAVRRVLLAHGLFGLDIVPTAFLRVLVEEHMRNRAEATIARGLPSPLYAMVCEESIIRILADLPDQMAIPEDPEQVVDTIAGAFQSAASDLSSALRTVSFAQYYGLYASGAPKYLPMSCPAEIQILEKAARAPAADGVLGRLSIVRESLIRTLEEANSLGPPRRHRCPPGSSRLRILYASNPSAFSGSEQCLINSIRALQEYSVEAHCLVAMEGVFTRRLREAGVSVHCPERDFATPSVSNMLQMALVLDRVKPHLIHCNAFAGTPLLAMAKLRRIPLLQWVRLAESNGLAEHLVCADAVTAVSHYVARRVAEQMIRAEKIHVLYDGVDCDHFAPGRMTRGGFRDQAGISHDEFVVLCIARFSPYKRHDILIEAIAAVRQENPLIRLVLVGEQQAGQEAYYGRCMAAVRQLGLERAVTTLDFREDIAAIEAASDAIVLCSEGEPLGTAILEGMASGIPVIVADSGGLPELVQHEVTGLHCNAGDPKSLAKQLSRLAENREFAQTLGANARRTALERFSLGVHGKALWDVYESIL